MGRPRAITIDGAPGLRARTWHGWGRALWSLVPALACAALAGFLGASAWRQVVAAAADRADPIASAVALLVPLVESCIATVVAVAAAACVPVTLLDVLAFETWWDGDALRCRVRLAGVTLVTTRVPRTAISAIVVNPERGGCAVNGRRVGGESWIVDVELDRPLADLWLADRPTPVMRLLLRLGAGRAAGERRVTVLAAIADRAAADDACSELAAGLRA